MYEQVDVERIEEELEKDNRDVTDLWNDALRSYKGIVGTGLTPTYSSVDEMIKTGPENLNASSRYRYDKKKKDELRTLFVSNLDLVKQGAKQIATVTPAFSPAVAISTAITHMLSACKQASADHDVITAFLEDVNAFLKRITILESRLPTSPPYRNCLVDAFTSVLELYGFATKYIQLRRFEQWLAGSFKGKDDGAGARQKVISKMCRLQAATEYAIREDTEKLEEMNDELQQHEDMQTQILDEQIEILEAVIKKRGRVQDDVKDIRKLLKVFEERRKDDPNAARRKRESAAGKPATSNRVRTFFNSRFGPVHEHRNLKDSFNPDMSHWIFNEPAWADWLQEDEPNSKLLYIAGSPGTGKSHIAFAAYEKLAQIANSDIGGNSCVTRFYFCETRDETRMFRSAIVSTIIQIAEWNDHFCQKINVELARDDLDVDVEDWRSLWDLVIEPLFNTPNNRLRIVLDGLDALAPDNVQRPAALDFLETIVQSDANVSVLCTTPMTSETYTMPTQLDDYESSSIVVTKEKQLPDLRTLIWQHLNDDSGLKRLSQYIRQKIASTLEEKSDYLLYAEHTLQKLGNLSREPLIRRYLEQEMPDSLEELYKASLSDTLRQTNKKQREALKSLFAWMAFSVCPITLSEAIALIELLPGELDLEEELQRPTLARFLQIAKGEASLDTFFDPPDLELEDSEQVNCHRDTRDEGYLLLKFRNRSMRDFFRSATPDEDPESLRTTALEAHRQIFVTLSETMSKREGTDISDRLRNYAAESWFTHLDRVEYYREQGDPTDEQKIEFLDALGALFTNRGHVATNIELSGMDYSSLGATTERLEVNIKFFSEWVADVEDRLKIYTVKFAKQVADDWENAFLMLAQAHVQNWYQANDFKDAQQSIAYALSALSQTNLRDNIPEDEAENTNTINVDKVQAVADAFPSINDRNASYATAVLLYGGSNHEAALPQAGNALELAGYDPVKVIEATNLLANIQYKLEQLETALDTISLISSSNADDIPPHLSRRTLVTRANIEAELDNIDNAIETFQAAHLAQPDTPMLGSDLKSEFTALLQYKEDDPAAIIAAIKCWSRLERLVWMTWNYDIDSRHHVDFQRACGRADEQDFMVQAYEEVIMLLDNVDAGTPIRLQLAIAHRKVCHDLDAAGALLDVVLDSHTDGSLWRFTQEDPAWTLVQTLNNYTDLLYEQFRTSTDPKRKAELVLQVKSLTQRPLGREISSWNSTANHQHVTLARLLKKMGPATEYQQVLQEAFDIAYETLFNDVGGNNSANLRSLAMVMSIMGGFETEAQILLSARFSLLNNTPEGGDQTDGDDKESEEKDEEEEQDEDDDDGHNIGDLNPHVFFHCDGECSTPWASQAWTNGPLYHCLICADISLCGDCHTKRQDYNDGAECEVGAEYCGHNHVYLKGPVDGWRGITNGVLRIEGETPVKFRTWLKELKEVKWKGAWEGFWLEEV